MGEIRITGITDKQSRYQTAKSAMGTVAVARVQVHVPVRDWRRSFTERKGRCCAPVAAPSAVGRCGVCHACLCRQVAVHGGHMDGSEYRNLGTGQASSGMEGASRTARCRGLWLVLETALRQMKAPGD